MVAVKPSSARKYTPRRKVYNKKPKVSFAKKVNQIIARNIENKITGTLTSIAPISTYVITGVVAPTPSVVNGYELNTFTPNSIFNMAQGTGMGARIGNKIKLKRWVIKGLIQPNKNFNAVAATPPSSGGQTTGISQNSFCGYVDIYFGRYANNVSPVINQPSIGMTNFYQNGAVDITPVGSSQEQLYNVNKDLYKIYYHKRIKVGTGSGFVGPTSGPLTYEPTAVAPGANGFGLTKSFGFDVCKFVCKNRILKYDELIQTPQDSDIENLTLWTIFHPAAGDMNGSAPVGTTTSVSHN
jgi:hypothetical protein